MQQKCDDESEKPDFAKVSEQLAKLDPTPEESEQDKRFDVICNGAKWGMLAGFALAQIIISNNSPLGFYLGGDLGLLFLKTMCSGTAIGALFGWLSLYLTDGQSD